MSTSNSEAAATPEQLFDRALKEGGGKNKSYSELLAAATGKKEPEDGGEKPKKKKKKETPESSDGEEEEEEKPKKKLSVAARKLAAKKAAKAAAAGAKRKREDSDDEEGDSDDEEEEKPKKKKKKKKKAPAAAAVAPPLVHIGGGEPWTNSVDEVRRAFALCKREDGRAAIKFWRVLDGGQQHEMKIVVGRVAAAAAKLSLNSAQSPYAAQQHLMAARGVMRAVWRKAGVVEPLLAPEMIRTDNAMDRAGDHLDACVQAYEMAKAHQAAARALMNLACNRLSPDDMAPQFSDATMRSVAEAFTPGNH